MNAQTLIDQYRQAAEAQELERAQRKHQAAEQAMDQFMQNCTTWLGDLWNDFTVGNATFYEKGSGNLVFRLPVIFLGLNGSIEAEYYPNRGQWDTAQLDFGHLRFSDKRGVNAYLYLHMDGIGETAVSPAAGDMGRLLSLLAEYKPVYEENRRLAIERSRQEALDGFSTTMNRAWNEARLQRLIAEFPDLKEQLQTRCAEAIQAYEEREQQRQAENQHYEDFRKEQERLQNLAAQAWKKPFDIYLITYGAFTTDEDAGTITRQFFSLVDHPEEDGYWRALDNGRASRRIKPIHVLSVELLTIWDQGGAPYEIQRHVELFSKTVEGASTWVSIPPLEIFAFDIEEMEAA